jgi:poly-gamma-glutamate capsule biosynthesis protein CapA/YwtB (metallophosphatase superfamily)
VPLSAPRRARSRSARVGALVSVSLAAALVAAGCSSGSGSPKAGSSPTGPSGGGVASSTSASPTPPPTTPPPPKPITMSFTGDFLLHSPVYFQAATNGQSTGMAYDFRPMLAQVKPLISSVDLAICHQETPVSADDTALSGYPVFNSPHEISIAAKWAGFDGCSLASNHSYDHGAAGIAATINAYTSQGIKTSGVATSAATRQPELDTVRGVKIALLDYTYSLNGFNLPAGQSYLVNLIDVPTILADAKAAKQAGADIVVVQMHWGDEYVATPSATQRQQATQILASPYVDAIVGGHVHVVQPVEKIGSKYVVYGVGNFLSNQSGECCPTSSQDGVIVTLHFKDTAGKWAVSNITYTPTYVDRAGAYVVWPAAAGIESSATSPALKQQLKDSFQRTSFMMNALHAPGVTPDAVPPGL